MKNLFTAAIISLSLLACNNENKSVESVKQSFATPPDSVRLGCYWYWINDNISKEGVIRDLEAMKEVGITRAQIGNVGFPDGEYGKVPFYSEEWWEITHATMKRATELDIEIGMFNSPGWSQSGGPWIKSERSMRYLTSVDTLVTGGKKIKISFKKPKNDFSDVITLAFHKPEKHGANFTCKNAKITSSVLEKEVTNMFDNNLNTSTILKDKEITIDITSTDKRQVNGLVVNLAEKGANFNAELLTFDGNDYKSVKKFNVNRTNGAVNVGFVPFAPIAVSFESCESDKYRIVLSDIYGGEITELQLTEGLVNEYYMEKQLAKMFQSPLPEWNSYLWARQPQSANHSGAVKSESVIDISPFLNADGTLEWDAPKGDWIIVRYGMTTTTVTNSPATPEATGLEVDKMSSEHTAFHFDAYIGEMLRRIPAEDRASFKYVIQDSYETGSQNWTDDFINTFKERYGYDPKPYILSFSGVVVDNYDLTDRFMWDVRRLIADKVAYDYVGTLRKESNKHGLKTWLENYGHWGFPGEFLLYGGQSDEVGGEYWAEGDLGKYENKAASSCAHIYGKSRIYSESFTASGQDFARHPRQIKKRGDWVYSEGVNSNILHLYIQQPYEDKNPGINQWFSTEFNRKNTWFKQGKAFFQYLRRNMFVLQQGVAVNDIAVFIGEDAPKMVGLVDPSIPEGYGYDFINADVIINRLSVKNGVFVLPEGTQYKIIVLPAFESARPELMIKLNELVEAGGTILGNAPSYSPSLENYPEADVKVAAISKKLWGDSSEKIREVGKGRVLSGMTLEEAFELLKVKPDFKVNDKSPLLYAHRSLDDAEIYFVSSQSDEIVVTSPQFRVSGVAPEFWNAVTGECRELTAFDTKGNITIVPLKLHPSESGFVVFRKSSRKPISASVDINFPSPKSETAINGKWNIEFLSTLSGEVAPPMVVDTLFDWSLSSDPRIKYYSGDARYSTTFTFTDFDVANRVKLSVDNVGVMAEVKINGIIAGTLWAYPLELDITDLIKAGENTLEIDVVNTWSNRLAGDALLPEKERVTWTTINSKGSLVSSGLIGKVKLNKY